VAIVRVYWDRCADDQNFGDQITRSILEVHGIGVEWAAPEDSELIGAGSILEAVPEGYQGVILGTGLMWRQRTADLSQARVLAVRGRLSLRRITHAGPKPVLADLGLLAGDLASGPRPRIRHSLGTIRHFIDHRPAMGQSIDVLADPAQVVETARACARLISSSLHGLVLADAIGVPSMWDPHPEVLGGGFKFRDYASSIGQPIEPYQWRWPDRPAIEVKQHQLRALLEQMQ
jgi:pyruvyltransferase